MQDSKFFDLLIVDDIYPSGFSPFRTIEYNHYMWFFDAGMLSLEGWHLWIENHNFSEHLANVDDRFKPRIFPFRNAPDIAAHLAYVTFLTNAARLLPYFRSQNLPFILQLYPGGGFEIGSDVVDDKLRTVLLDPLCVKVITTQTITKDYIIDKIGCDPDKVEFIFGGVFDSNVKFDFIKDKRLFGRDKQTLDLCFVAHRYGDDLSSKGYDFFVETAKRLASDFPALRFHVVGGYKPEDIDITGVADRFTFYGAKPTAFFSDFYPQMDAIISFNKPFVLAPGAFDGFPTGACLEAGFRGVANIINDPLKLNADFKDGVDLLLLDDDLDKSVVRIAELLRNPSDLEKLGQGTYAAFRRVMDVNRQLWLRTKIIADEIQKQSHRPLVTIAKNYRSPLDGEMVQTAVQPYVQTTHRLNTELQASVQTTHRLDTELQASVQTTHRLNTEIENLRSEAARIAALPSRKVLRKMKSALLFATGRSRAA